MKPLLEVRNLVKRFPAPGGHGSVWAVNDVSFELYKGETLGLVGESGSGKTTVGRCVLRLLEPSSGEILFGGKSITHLSSRRFRPLRRHVQIVFQEPYDALDPRKSIGDAISEPLRLVKSVTLADRIERLRSVAALVGIRDDDLERYPHELSDGLLQRAGVARAMITDPALVVLDEPTSLLDATARAEIISLLMKLQSQTGVSYIFISHDLNTVEHMTDRIAVMYLGKIVETGSRAQIFSNPLHPYTRSLLSAVLSPGLGRQQEPTPLIGEIPSPIDLPSGCFLHGRCPVASTSCSAVVPSLVNVGDGHEVSCIRLAPLPDQIVGRHQIIRWVDVRGFGFMNEGDGNHRGSALSALKEA